MENEKDIKFVDAEATAIDGQAPATEDKADTADTTAEKKPNVFKRALDYAWDHKGKILKAGLIAAGGIALFMAGKKSGSSIRSTEDDDVKQIGYDEDDSDYSDNDADETDYDDSDEDVAEDYTEEEAV